MHSELLSMTPINSRFVISHMRCCPRTSSLALELEEKPLDLRSSADGFKQHGHLIFADATLVSQTGPGAQSEHASRAQPLRRFPLGTVSWNVCSNLPTRPQLI